MAYMTAHDKREGADLRWPQDIGIRSCLGSPFHYALVDRSQLVHMVALIGT